MVLSRKFLIAVLLVLCVGVQLLEASGRWDRTFKDANDEAGIVVIVLCVGIAIAVATNLFLRALPSPVRLTALVSSVILDTRGHQSFVVLSCDGPPLSLRI